MRAVCITRLLSSMPNDSFAQAVHAGGVSRWINRTVRCMLHRIHCGATSNQQLLSSVLCHSKRIYVVNKSDRQ
jgi:hypothetical protein